MEPLLQELLSPVRDEVEEMSRFFERELAAPSAVLRELVGHLSRYKGKRLRGTEVLLVGKAFGPLGPEHVPVAAIVEMIHTATLVHDDVLDVASLRRGLASVNARYGNPTAVLLGDYIYAKAFHLSTGLRSQVASRLLADTTRTVCRGEIEQTAARFDFDLTEARYLELIDMKTASLHGAACELGARYAGEGEETALAMRGFGRDLGRAFQIVDDCLDLEGDERIVGKSLGTDVSEGKITLPVVHLLAGLPPPRAAAGPGDLSRRGDRGPGGDARRGVRPPAGDRVRHPVRGRLEPEGPRVARAASGGALSRRPREPRRVRALPEVVGGSPRAAPAR